MCIDMALFIAVYVGVDMCVDMFAELRVDKCAGLCMYIDLCADIYVDICARLVALEVVWPKVLQQEPICPTPRHPNGNACYILAQGTPMVMPIIYPCELS